MLKSWANKLMLTIALAISSIFFYTDGHKLDTLHGDAFGYYLYLPSTFIYHNIVHFWEIPEEKLPGDDVLRRFLRGMLADGTRTAEGAPMNQYTYGVAFMEMPFFLVAHAYEEASGLPASGFSKSYEVAIKVSGLFYLVAGLLLVYKILRRYYNSNIATFTTLALLLGSNLFYFGLYQTGMSHVPLFFLFALIIYLTIKVHERPTTFLFLMIGFVAGLITVTRPTDIVCLLIPLLYQVYNRETFLRKKAFILQHYKKVLGMIVVFIIPALPQMAYWYAVSGKFIYYSYGKQQFYWMHPRLLDGLIGPNNGWLTYSPLMIFAVAGYLIFKKNRDWRSAMCIVVPIFCYVIYSWYCYNYINGLGSRPMIHMYPLLAFPMAACFEYFSKRNVVVKSLMLATVLFFISVNISYSILQKRRKFNSEESNYAFNFSMIWHSDLRYKDLLTKDLGQLQPDSQSLSFVRRLGFQGFEDSVAGHAYPNKSNDGNNAYLFDDEENFEQTINIKYHDSVIHDARWLRCSGDFLCLEPAGYFKHLFLLRVIRDGESIVWAPCKVENKIGVREPGFDLKKLTIDYQHPGIWSNVSYFVKMPAEMREGDLIVLSVWNVGRKPLCVDNLQLDLYR